jgi:hypothetical protein
LEREGIRVVDDIAVPGVFPEEAYSTGGRFGTVTDRPSAQDLREVEGRVPGILRRLRRVLPLGDAFL